MGDDFKLYVNGILEHSVTTSRTIPASDPATDKTILGSAENGNPSFGLLGLADDIGIYDSAEDAVRIAAVHGLGRYSHVDLNDSSIADVLGVYSDKTGSAVSGGLVWEYATGLPSTLVGATGSLGDRFYIVLDNQGNGVTGVPEPASLLLLALGVCLLLPLLRRRKKA